MTLKDSNRYDKDIFSDYREIEALTNKKNSPMLVRHSQTKEFYVRKKYDIQLKEKINQLKHINHPNLPKIKDALLVDNDFWIFEEYIHGQTLATILKNQQYMDTDEVIHIGISIADALIILHAENLVHRDVTPNNIMITADNMIKLIDFDTVRFHTLDKEMDTVNLGTVGFASPEQFGFAQTDERSDIYSLGVVLNVCSEKKHPKEAITSDKSLAEIILKATKLDPFDRYHQVTELKEALIKAKIFNEKKQMPLTTNIKKKIILHTRAAVEPVDTFLKAYVPGFRTNHVWKKIVAIAGYTIFFMLFFSSKDEATIWDVLLDGIGNIVMLVPFFLILTNTLNIKQQLPLIREKNILKKIGGYFIFLAIWLLLAGSTLLLIERLHTPAYIEAQNQK